MACKLAIATTYIPNHWEILGKNRNCGLFMEPTENTLAVNDGTQMIKVPSSKTIEETLRFMLDNPDECDAMGENGLKRVKQYYNLAKVSDAWLDLLDKIGEE